MVVGAVDAHAAEGEGGDFDLSVGGFGDDVHAGEEVLEGEGYGGGAGVAGQVNISVEDFGAHQVNIHRGAVEILYFYAFVCLVSSLGNIRIDFQLTLFIIKRIEGVELPGAVFPGFQVVVQPQVVASVHADVVHNLVYITISPHCKFGNLVGGFDGGFGGGEVGGEGDVGAGVLREGFALAGGGHDQQEREGEQGNKGLPDRTWPGDTDPVGSRGRGLGRGMRCRTIF